MKSIAARMESAESELKNLQNTCRDLIVRTAATHSNKNTQIGITFGNIVDSVEAICNNDGDNASIQSNSSPTTSRQRRNKRNNSRRNSRGSSNSPASNLKTNEKLTTRLNDFAIRSNTAPDSGDPDDGNSDGEIAYKLSDDDNDDKKSSKPGWVWRIAKIALPMQLALITLFCVACLMQPNCCDNLNNLSMSFTPHLRYVRGPPPI